MPSKDGGSDCRSGSTNAVDDKDVANTLFATDVSCVPGVKMVASDAIMVNLVSSLLLRKASIGSCGAVGSRGCFSMSSSLSSSISLL